MNLYSSGLTISNVSNASEWVLHSMLIGVKLWGERAAEMDRGRGRGGGIRATQRKISKDNPKRICEALFSDVVVEKTKRIRVWSMRGAGGAGRVWIKLCEALELKRDENEVIL